MGQLFDVPGGGSGARVIEGVLQVSAGGAPAEAVATEANQTTEIAHLAAIEVATEAAIAQLTTGVDSFVAALAYEAVLADVPDTVVARVRMSPQRGLHVVQRANDGSEATRGAVVDRSLAIAVGGTAEDLAVENLDRKYLHIENIDDTDSWYSLVGSAAANTLGSHLLGPGDSVTWEYGTFVPTNAVSVVGATAGKKISAEEG